MTKGNDSTHETLLAILDGSTFANGIMPWGNPGPIRLPDDADARAALVEAHIEGGPAEVLYSPADREPELVRVDSSALAAVVPDAAGFVRWLGMDLDASDHGASGLADPTHAMRCIASAAESAGLLSGLLAARSRGGRGRHVWLLLPSPVSLADGVPAVSEWATRAYRLAYADVRDYGGPHAFGDGSGGIVRPGSAGGVELYPPSDERPALGWALCLPAGGAFRECGGGVIVDGFGDQPYGLDGVPKCDARQWARFLSEAGEARPASKPTPRLTRPARLPNGTGDPLGRIDPRTRDFLDGRIEQGGRNRSAFAAACNLLGVGVDAREVERLVIAGGVACGLSERELRTCVASAIGAFRRRRGEA